MYRTRCARKGGWLVAVGALGALLAGGAALGGPLSGLPVVLTQPDGATFTALPGGDEWFNWVSHEGVLIARDAGGWWCYAEPGGAGLRPGAARVGRRPAPAAALTVADVPALAAGAARPAGLWAPEAAGALRSTARPVLVVLVEFQDRALTTADAYWSNLFFGTSGATVRNYFREASGGGLDLVPAAESSGTANDGIVRVQLQIFDHNGGNHPDPYGTIDDRNRWIVYDALLRTDPVVYYRTFDTAIPYYYITPDELHIVIVVAGYEHGYSGAAAPHPAVHGHRWALGFTYAQYVPAPAGDEMFLCGWYGDPLYDSGYSQIGELHDDHPAVIGEVCHELGHDMGLPDLYDTTFNSHGIGAWGLMGYGGWGRAAGDAYVGTSPVHPCAWSKCRLGFAMPQVATGNRDYTLAAAGSGAYGVVKVATSDPDEQFLLENRQLAGFDAGLYRWFSQSSGGTGGGGLAIWHVDSSVADNNNWSHKLVDLEEANFATVGYGELDYFPPYPEDPVPYQGNRDHLYYAGHAGDFGDATTPGSRLYSGAPTYINVSAVSVSGPAMKCFVATGLATRLAWSTYFGGTSDDRITGAALDSSGCLYVTGQTGSGGVPTTAGAYDTTVDSPYPSFVAKFSSDGTLLYATLLETNYVHGTYAEDIAVDSAGCAYVTGATGDGFPTTPGAYDRTWNGQPDAFVTKFNQAGSALVYSSYLGSPGQDKGLAIAVDGSGCAHVTGETNTTGFPTTGAGFAGAIDAFVTKFNASGSGLSYSRYLGGSDAEHGYAIAIDGSGLAHVTCDTWSSNFPTTTGAYDTTYAFWDATFTRLNATGAALYSSFLGTGGAEVGYGIAADSLNYGYVVGQTGSANFPTTEGAYCRLYGGGTSDAFVTKFNPTSGAALAYSTFLGGSGADEAIAIVLDAQQGAHVAGTTDSDDFPTVEPLAATRAGGVDAFYAHLRSDGAAPLLATYLGGSGDESLADVARHASGAIYLVGGTASTDFPTTAGAYAPDFCGGTTDGYIAKLVRAQVTASLVVGVPDGGETWCIGRTVTLRWSSSGAGSTVQIELSRSGLTGPWETLLASTANDGAEDWVVTGPAAADCCIRITDSSDPPLVDVSNAAFSIAACYPLGDLDCDGAVTFNDIDPFVVALSGQSAYEALYPDCYWTNADCNDDGSVDFEDIDAFVVLLSGGQRR